MFHNLVAGDGVVTTEPKSKSFEITFCKVSILFHFKFAVIFQERNDFSYNNLHLKEIT